MSDNKNDIDLDKEIENLEGLLNEHDESLGDTFPLDDDFDDELTATPRNQKSKSGAGKYVAYFAFLALLGGGGYAAYKYLPNMLQNDTLMALQTNVNNRTATIEPQEIIPQTSSVVMSPEVEKIQIVEAIDTTSDLPVAADSDEIIIIDTDNSNGFDEIVETSEPEMQKTIDSFETGPAETIAEALAIAQTADDEVLIVEDKIVETDEDVADTVAEVQSDVEDVIENTNNVMTSFERVPAMPILKGEEIEEVLPAVVEGKIEEDVADTIVETEIEVELPEPEQMSVVDTEVIEEPVVEIVAETPQLNEPEIDLMEVVAEEMQVPTTPVVEEVIQVEEKKITPVAVTKSEPKEIVVNNKPLAKVDDRVTQARLAMEQGNVQAALDLYQAVLNDNPSSTSALTGMQLAKAKLRLSGQQVTDQNPSVVTMPVVPAVSAQSNDLSLALAQMAANPRDASLAVKVAELYKAQGQTAKAVEYYRKALQLDIVYKSGLDRMAIYDALSALQ